MSFKHMTPDEVISLDGGWFNVFPVHRHVGLWKPWCSYLEIWTFEQDEPTCVTKKFWTRRRAQDGLAALMVIVREQIESASLSDEEEGP